MTTPTFASRRRALWLGMAMGTAAIASALRAPATSVAASPPALDLSQLFPPGAGTWSLDHHADVFVRPTDQRTSKVYGVYDQVLERIYVGADGSQLMLCVAYGGRQSDGLQVHRPENCYRAAGFEVSGLTRTQLQLSGKDVPASQLHAARADRSEPITYWTIFGDEVENEPREVEWMKIRAGLQGQILDGMLVRISSLDRDTRRAHDLQARFADALVQAIDPRYRSRVIGA
jgi:EpsI family protein